MLKPCSRPAQDARHLGLIGAKTFGRLCLSEAQIGNSFREMATISTFRRWRHSSAMSRSTGIVDRVRYRTGGEPLRHATLRDWRDAGD